MIKQNTGTAKHAIFFSVVPGQIKTSDLADAVRATWVKSGFLILRRFANTSEHLAASGKIKFAFRLQFLERSKKKVSPADIGGHGRDSIRETFCHEALCRQMVTLVESMLAKYMEQAWVTLQVRAMKYQLVKHVFNSSETSLRVFHCDSPNQTMHLIAVSNQSFGKVATVLTGDTGDQRPFNIISQV